MKNGRKYDRSLTAYMRDQIAYANQWGDPATWHGRVMYISPEGFVQIDRHRMLEFIAAIGATIGDVRADPAKHDPGDAEDLTKLLEWVGYTACAWCIF